MQYQNITTMRRKTRHQIIEAEGGAYIPKSQNRQPEGAMQIWSIRACGLVGIGPFKITAQNDWFRRAAAAANTPPAQDRLLTTAEAVEYLASLGVRTSRRMLDQLRTQGALSYVKTRGRVRILYRLAELAAAYLKDKKNAPQNFPPNAPRQLLCPRHGRRM